MNDESVDSSLNIPNVDIMIPRIPRARTLLMKRRKAIKL